MSARVRNESGAALILALAFITLIGVATAVLANLAFSSQKAAVIYTDQGRFANALDSGLQAAIENARVVEPFGCDTTTPLTTAANGHSVGVTCTGAAAADAASPATLRFTAAEIVTGPCTDPRPPELHATVAFSTIGASATGYRVARTTSWKIAPSTPCPTTP